LAADDERIWLLTADLGFSVLERFAERFPTRYVNVGVAEQNMTGVACGIALEGNVVVTYSIGNFPTMRCLEQIRDDVCYHKANVKIVIVGGGMAYGALGVSHHATEDLAILRALPDLVVLAPADFAEARAAVHAMIAHEGPVYFRCGRKKEPPLHSGPIQFQIGRAILVREGADVTLIGTGTISYRALQASQLLEQQGVRARVLSMHTVKPLDTQAVLDAAHQTGAIVTLEENTVLGGLGGAVAEVLAESGLGVPFKRMGIPDTYAHVVGSQDWLLDYYGLSVQDIAQTAKELVARKGQPRAGS